MLSFFPPCIKRSISFFNSWVVIILDRLRGDFTLDDRTVFRVLVGESALRFTDCVSLLPCFFTVSFLDGSSATDECSFVDLREEGETVGEEGVFMIDRGVLFKV
jgi:hypothetical protein